MGRILIWVLLGVFAMGARSQTAGRTAQTLPLPQGAAVDATMGDALRSLGGRAGTVFVGTVTQIRRDQDLVYVELSVERPVVGEPGAGYELREWAGFWSGGRERYRVGQTALWFLYPATPEGVSSPVDGMDGVVPVVQASAVDAPLLDVRRLAARLQRAPGTPLQGEAIALAEAESTLRAWAAGSVVEPSAARLPLGLRPQAPKGLLHVDGAQ